MDGDCLPHSLKFEFPTIWNLKTKDVFLSYLFIYLSIYLPTYLSTDLSIYLSDSGCHGGMAYPVGPHGAPLSRAVRSQVGTRRKQEINRR